MSEIAEILRQTQWSAEEYAYFAEQGTLSREHCTEAIYKLQQAITALHEHRQSLFIPQS